MGDLALRDCGRWLSGGTPDTENPAYWGGVIPWITASSLKGRYLDRSVRQLTKEGVAAGSRLVEPGTLIFVVRGMSLKNEFRVGIATRQLAFGQDCKALVPAEGIDPKYLLFALEAAEDRVLRMVDEASHGTGRLQTALLGSLEVRVPPVEEQRRIVEILDTIDETIQATERVIVKLNRGRVGLMTDVLMPKADWENERLGDFCELTNGLTLDASRWSADGLPIIRIQNLNGGTEFNYWRDPVDDRYLIQTGDVLFSWSGNRGTSFGPYRWNGPLGVLNQHIFKVSPTRPVDTDWLLATLDHARRRAESEAHGGSGLVHVTKSALASYEIGVPPLVKQERIGSVLRAHDARLRAERSALGKLLGLRRGLAADLLSGRVRTVAE
jgi:type I restriction enzyme S subunit